MTSFDGFCIHRPFEYDEGWKTAVGFLRFPSFSFFFIALLSLVLPSHFSPFISFSRLASGTIWIKTASSNLTKSASKAFSTFMRVVLRMGDWLLFLDLTQSSMRFLRCTFVPCPYLFLLTLSRLHVFPTLFVSLYLFISLMFFFLSFFLTANRTVRTLPIETILSTFLAIGQYGKEKFSEQIYRPLKYNFSRLFSFFSSLLSLSLISLSLYFFCLSTIPWLPLSPSSFLSCNTLMRYRFALSLATSSFGTHAPSTATHPPWPIALFPKITPSCLLVASLRMFAWRPAIVSRTQFMGEDSMHSKTDIPPLTGLRKRSLRVRGKIRTERTCVPNWAMSWKHWYRFSGEDTWMVKRVGEWGMRVGGGGLNCFLANIQCSNSTSGASQWNAKHKIISLLICYIHSLLRRRGGEREEKKIIERKKRKLETTLSFHSPPACWHVQFSD